MRPGIKVTASYGRSGNLRGLALSRIGSDRALDDATLDLLLGELVPVSERGRKTGKGSHLDGLAGSTTSIYENVEIERLIFSNPGPNYPAAPSATIRFPADQ